MGGSNAEREELLRDKNGNIKKSERFFNSDGTRVLRFRPDKQTPGGVIYVAECVPDSANKRIWAISAYANKKGSKGQLLNIEDKSSPQLTPETPFDSDATMFSIRQNGEIVNPSAQILWWNCQQTRPMRSSTTGRTAYPYEVYGDTDAERAVAIDQPDGVRFSPASDGVGIDFGNLQNGKK